MDIKVMVLRNILEAKELLFGSFSDVLTKQDKRKKWEEITNLCRSRGVISATKDFKYMRDVYWPNIKKSTMKNPMHTVPVLEDGDLILHDSHAILMYLAGVYDKQNSLYPKDLKQRALVDQKLFFNISFLFMRLRNISYPLMIQQIQPTEKHFKELEEACGFLEVFLSGVISIKFLAGGSMTIADIAAYATTSSLGFLVKLDGHKYPKIQAWMKEMEQLPCAKKYNAPGVQAYEYKELVTSRMTA